MPAVVGGLGNSQRAAAAGPAGQQALLASGSGFAAGAGITPAFPDPVGQSAGVWTGVFREEFTSAMTVTDSGLGLVNFGGPTWATWFPNTTNWTSQSPGGNHTNNTGREKEYYDPSAISVSAGVASLTATFDSAHSGLPYTSGMLSTFPTYKFQYGYIETRMKLPRVAGTWPAFWLPVADVTGGTIIWSAEVDMMEQFGNTATYGVTTWRNGSGSLSPGDLNLSPVTTDTSQFHVYGLKWTSAGMWFYLDGSQVKLDTNNLDNPANNMYVVINLAIDGNQSFTDGVGYPCKIDVDYVRCWV